MSKVSRHGSAGAASELDVADGSPLDKPVSYIFEPASNTFLNSNGGGWRTPQVGVTG